MKATILFALLFCVSIHNAQTTYTYTGSGNWNVTSNWTPSYPGTSIAHLDEVIIPNGSNVTVNSTTTIYGKLTVNGSLESISIFNVVGEFIANGSFTNKSFFTNFGTSTLNASASSNSIFKNEGTLTIKSTFSSSSTFTTDNGGITVSQSTFTNTSSFKVEFGGSFKNTGTLNSTGTITNNGTFTNENNITSNTFINNNSLVNDLGSISFNSSVYYLMGNNVSHTGNHSISNRIAPRTSVDNDYNPISPANPIGVYAFDDNITFMSSARIEADLKSDVLFDKITIGGTASLSGILQVNLVDSYDPAVGTKIEILQATSGISGTFSSVILPDLGATKEFQVNYNANIIELEVVSSALSLHDTDTTKFKAFPNPVKDALHVRGLLNNEKVMISSITGKKLIETNVSLHNNTIQVDNLTPGIYIVTIANSSFKISKI
ncbi:T9SS type A sorting domain-containing protein [Seonamhaeicola marinus]|uniref:T9SS type A sorting domain-containing protein n=1 Tax=Seonamhaeicola marinus TaxID=1912246 RepID=A0A5D0HKX8_9FLAO|nr:T9SS type A sorting domain-containing protein [Seonamhaeicola marinus]TYA71915.1 T9SS type A sorting domain-containing protein [Seonamhaeicola marinus]